MRRPDDGLLTGRGIVPTKDQEEMRSWDVGLVFGPGDDLRGIVDSIKEGPAG